MKFWKLFFNKNKEKNKNNSATNQEFNTKSEELNFYEVLDNLMTNLGIEFDKLDTNTLALPPGTDNSNNNGEDNSQDVREDDNVDNISNDRQEDIDDNLEGKNSNQLVPSDTSNYEQDVIDDGKEWDERLKDNSYAENDMYIKQALEAEGYIKLDNGLETKETINNQSHGSNDAVKVLEENNEDVDYNSNQMVSNDNSYEQEVIDDNGYDTNSNVSGIELIIIVEILTNLDISGEEYKSEVNNDVEIVDEQELEENNSNDNESNNTEKEQLDNNKKIEENKNAEFLNELKDIPNFEERDRSDGYSFNLENSEEVNNRIIKVLIQKFLNQRFKRNDSDLNIRTNSLERKQGFYKWDVKKVIIHKETKQVFNLLNDKYGYNYAEGKNEYIPLSFYFDLSGSMANYSGTLATIAIELLKKKIKVLVGFNEKVNVQIEEIKPSVTIEDLVNFLSNAGNNSCDYEDLKRRYLDIKFRVVNNDIDDYLINAKAEKCVIFSDFDARGEIINLSNYCNLYWFCFESGFSNSNITGYKGFIYEVETLDDIKMGLLKVNENRFETLVHINNIKKKERK